MKKSLITLAVLVMSAAFALTGAGQAQADGDGGLCWNGWLWSACVQGPGWVDWNPGWNGNWDNGWHGHGHGHDD
jgi:hypothetical protein